MFRSLRSRIGLLYVLLIFASMSALAIYVSRVVEQTELDGLRAQLAGEARLIADRLSATSNWDVPGVAIDELVDRLSDVVGARVTLIAMDGEVIADSASDPATMDNHLSRPEIQEVVATGQGSSVRSSQTMGYEMMYVAVPVRDGGRHSGIARVALPVTQIEATVRQLRWTVFGAALATAAVAALLAVLIARRTTEPLGRLTSVVKRMAEGDLSARLLPMGRDEVGVLTAAVNDMADRLRKTVTTLLEERGRLAGVLDNMADGVLIADADGMVRLVNPAAAELLGTTTHKALGKPITQVLRDHEVIELWQKCMGEAEEQSVSLDQRRTGRFLHVIATPLQDAEPDASLIVLQDLTRVRQLERVRSDFVSNLSHELRTPLASLKALVDTLREGALEDAHAARRFLDRMETELDALTHMVRELLELARIESGQVPFSLGPIVVADALLPAVERLRPQADRAGVHLTTDLPPDLPLILGDAQRLQQVFTNLLHNAVKFSAPGGVVSVFARTITVDAGGPEPRSFKGFLPASLPAGRWVLFEVKDTGAGIPAEHLPRIFERFYKADRARSGGGTGLGLAIAKHIVLGHGGHIWVSSIEGQGSSFYVALPAALTPDHHNLPSSSS